MAKDKKREGAEVARPERSGELEPLWGPFSELGWARPWRVSRVMDELFGEAARTGRGLGVAMDVSEDEKVWVVTAEVPGASPDDVHVDIQDDMLTVRGEKKSEREGKKENRRWTERTYGSFSRSFRIPANADVDRIEASFRDGVLTVEIPKREESKPRRVSIRS